MSDGKYTRAMKFIMGDDYKEPGHPSPSEGITPEQGETKVVAAVPTCSPAVIEAEPFIAWLTEQIIELQRGREAAHQSGNYATAERRKNYAAAYETVKFKLQRQMERATVRQPQENT